MHPSDETIAKPKGKKIYLYGIWLTHIIAIALIVFCLPYLSKAGKQAGNQNALADFSELQDHEKCAKGGQNYLTTNKTNGSE